MVRHGFNACSSCVFIQGNHKVLSFSAVQHDFQAQFIQGKRVITLFSITDRGVSFTHWGEFVWKCPTSYVCGLSQFFTLNGSSCFISLFKLLSIPEVFVSCLLSFLLRRCNLYTNDEAGSRPYYSARSPTLRTTSWPASRLGVFLAMFVCRASSGQLFWNSYSIKSRARRGSRRHHFLLYARLQRAHSAGGYAPPPSDWADI